MRARLAAILVMAMGCNGKAPKQHGVASTPRPLAPPPTAPQGEIVTAEVEEMNSPRYGRPPTEFQKGHPTPRQAPKATRTQDGFQVQFESHATITTPTVYERAVIVSGGFKSEQLYAFDKETGDSLWALDLHDDGPSSPACDRGVCVISTESCTIFAIAADTGKELWSFYLGDPLTSAPTIAGDRVFASYPAMATSDGKEMPPSASHALAAFDLKTGAILWQIWLDSDVMSAPVAVGEFVYVNTFAGTVIKLEQATGKIRYAMRAAATSAPVVEFDANGVESMYYTKRGVDAPAASGAPSPATESIIRTDHNEPQTRYEAAKRKADYIDSTVQGSSSHAQKAAAEDSANGFSAGAPVAANAGAAYRNVGVSSVSSMQSFQGSRILKLRDRSVNTMGDEVVATDAETGTTLWTYKLAGNLAQQGGFLGTAPLAAGASIMFGTLDGKVVRLDQASGKALKTWDVASPVRSQPVVDGGWIYVGTDDGKLVAINTKDKTITGWPTWGGNAQRTGIARY